MTAQNTAINANAAANTVLTDAESVLREAEAALQVDPAGGQNRVAFDAEAIAVQIDAIIDARKRLLPQISADKAELERQAAEIRDLMDALNKLQSIEKDLDANRAIRSAMDDLKAFKTQAYERISALAELEAEFNRDTLNLGVSGAMRVGKSTTLQKISGLTDEQIPTGNGLPVTAVRSEIHNSDRSCAEVKFRTKREFVEDYLAAHVANVNAVLPDDSKLSIDSLEALESANLPAVLEGEVTSVAQDSLQKLQQAQRGIPTFEGYLGGFTQVVGLDELRKFVAYPTDADEVADDKGEHVANRAYLAVKSVTEFCPFPGLGRAKVALVDLPGLGEVGKSVAEMHLKGLEDKVDQVLLVISPTTRKGVVDSAISFNLDQLRLIQPGVRNRSDLITVGVNVVKGTEECAETLVHSFERSVNATLPESERFVVKEYSAIDAGQVSELFAYCLDKLAKRQPEMDRQKMAYVTGGDLGAGIGQAIVRLRKAMADIQRKIPSSHSVMKRRIDEVSRGIVRCCDAFEYELNNLSSTKAEARVQFEQKVRDAHDYVESRLADMFCDSVGEWESRVLGNQDLYVCYRQESRRLRREVIDVYKDLEVVYSEHVEDFKMKALSQVLVNLGQVSRTLGFDNITAADERIRAVDSTFAAIVGDAGLHEACEMLMRTRFDFVGNLFLKIENHLALLENPKDDNSFKRTSLGHTGNAPQQLNQMRKYLQDDVRAANKGIQKALLSGSDDFNHYLAVSMAFFNDYLYRRDEDSFKQVIVRGLVSEYSQDIFPNEQENGIEPRKRRLLDEITACIDRIDGGRL